MSKSASEVLAELRDRAGRRIETCVKEQRQEEYKFGCNTDEGNFLGVEIEALNTVLRWIYELSTSDDEQTQPGLLPCPFCGGTPRNSSSEDDCGELVHKVKCECGGEFVSRGETEQSAEEGWNTRANKTQ